MLELERLPVTDMARQEFVRMLRRMVGQRVYFSKAVLIDLDRVKLARVLLNEGHAVAAVRALLSERKAIGPRSAYRSITRALNERGKDRTDG